MNKFCTVVVYLSYFWSSKGRVFLCQPSDECSVFGGVWLLICYFSMLVWRSPLSLSRHLAILLSRLGWAWLAPALLHCREVQESSRTEPGGFLRYKNNPVYHRPLSSWRRQQFGDIKYPQSAQSAWKWIWTWVIQTPDSSTTAIISTDF